MKLNWQDDGQGAADVNVTGRPPGAPSFIASILNAIGIGKQVGAIPKQKDLASGLEDKPTQRVTETVDKKGNKVGRKSVLDQADSAMGIKPLPMIIAPISPNGMQFDKPLQAINPDSVFNQ